MDTTDFLDVAFFCEILGFVWHGLAPFLVFTNYATCPLLSLLCPVTYGPYWKQSMLKPCVFTSIIKGPWWYFFYQDMHHKGGSFSLARLFFWQLNNNPDYIEHQSPAVAWVKHIDLFARLSFSTQQSHLYKKKSIYNFWKFSKTHKCCNKTR